MSDLLDRLTTACSGNGDDAMITFRAELAPEDPSAKVAPPTYPEGSSTPDGRKTQYVLERRLVDGQPRDVVQLDSVQSQANRAEEALDQARTSGEVDLPGFAVVSRVDEDRTITISSLQMPHRYADAYLMNSVVDGTPFDKSAVGRTLQLATPEDATVLYERSPESLIYGAWNSHRKGRQAKFARIYRSEVIGLDPLVGSRRAGRMDPENLAGQAKVAADGSWEFAASNEKVKGSRLSERGLGNIAPQEGPGGVTVSNALRLGSLSFAGAQRLCFGAASDAASAAGRAALIALALYADRLAFGQPSLWLRSGCDLVVVQDEIAFLGRGGAREVLHLDVAAALALFLEARAHADSAGITMATDRVTLQASKPLQDAIKFAYLRAGADEAS